jgi:hypothetical protein
MSSMAGNRGLGFFFGALGVILIALEGLLDLARGFVFAAVARPVLGLGFLTAAVLFIVIAIVLGFFVLLGSRGPRDRTLTAGVILVVLALVGFLVLGFAGGLLALLGGVFVLIGGLLYLFAAR